WASTIGLRTTAHGRVSPHAPTIRAAPYPTKNTVVDNPMTSRSWVSVSASATASATSANPSMATRPAATHSAVVGPGAGCAEVDRAGVVTTREPTSRVL